MPELPEVETILRGIKTRILEQRIIKVYIRQSKLRWQIPISLKSNLVNSFFSDISRRGKYLLLTVNNGGTLILHLGMSGRLQILPKDHQVDKHEHFVIDFANEKSLTLIDPRRFGAVLWTEEDPLKHKLLSSLGPEPLTPDFSGEYLVTKCKNKNTSIKQLLMNSKIVVGVGNIYANEALYFAGIKPHRTVKTLTPSECSYLVKAVKNVLKKAIKNGGTTIRDYVTSDGSLGYFQNELQVYGRSGELCFACQSKIKESRISNRSTFYCEKCQK